PHTSLRQTIADPDGGNPAGRGRAPRSSTGPLRRRIVPPLTPRKRGGTERPTIRTSRMRCLWGGTFHWDARFFGTFSLLFARSDKVERWGTERCRNLHFAVPRRFSPSTCPRTSPLSRLHAGPQHGPHPSPVDRP